MPEARRVHIKICGVTSPADAEACVALGVASIGINFVPSSPRRVDLETARAIARSVRTAEARAGAASSPSRVVVVGVVADLPLDAMVALVQGAELDCLQLHGDEPPELLTPLLPHAYKAIRVATREDVARARSYPGEHLLVDAKVAGALGGTGETFDWALVRELARERSLTLAGGLHPGNVEAAIAAVEPYCVDVASGVESAPGKKDFARVRAFVEAVQRARG